MSRQATIDVLAEVVVERASQDYRWGEQNHEDGTGRRPGSERRARDARAQCERAFWEGYGTWAHIFTEEALEALAESDPQKLRAELVQVAAVAVAWIEAIDRRAS